MLARRSVRFAVPAAFEPSHQNSRHRSNRESVFRYRLFSQRSKSNRRSHLPDYAAWELHPVMRLKVVHARNRRTPVSDAKPVSNLQVIRVYDGAGNVIGTHEHKLRLSAMISQYFTAAFPRRVFGSVDHSGADRTLDRAEAARE